MTGTIETVQVSGPVNDLANHAARQATDALSNALELCETPREQAILIIATLSLFVAEWCAVADVMSERGARVPTGADTLESVRRSATDLIRQCRPNVEAALSEIPAPKGGQSPN